MPSAPTVSLSPLVARLHAVRLVEGAASYDVSGCVVRRPTALAGTCPLARSCERPLGVELRIGGSGRSGNRCNTVATRSSLAVGVPLGHPGAVEPGRPSTHARPGPGPCAARAARAATSGCIGVGAALVEPGSGVGPAGRRQHGLGLPLACAPPQPAGWSRRLRFLAARDTPSAAEGKGPQEKKKLVLQKSIQFVVSILIFPVATYVNHFHHAARTMSRRTTPGAVRVAFTVAGFATCIYTRRLNSAARSDVLLFTTGRINWGTGFQRTLPFIHGFRTVKATRAPTPPPRDPDTCLACGGLRRRRQQYGWTNGLRGTYGGWVATCGNLRCRFDSTARQAQ